MPKKLLIFLIAFVVLVATATFFLIYKNKLGLFSNIFGGNKVNDELSRPLAAVEKKGSIFIIRGRMVTPFKYDDAREYLVGEFTINNDPNESVVTVLLSSQTTDKLVTLAEFTEGFGGVPKVRFSTLDEVRDIVKEGDPVEFGLNSDILSYTGRPANKRELATIDTLNSIVGGQWEKLIFPDFIVFTNTVGIIK
jgi:hypothetical protein